MPDLTLDAWARIRTAYEHTDIPVEDICLEHGISSTTLRNRMRRWRWTRRRPPIPREGPPAVPAPQGEIAATLPLPACGERSAAGAERGRPGEEALPNPENDETPPHPISSLRSETHLSPHAGRGGQAVPAPPPPPAAGEEAPADAAAIVPRLQSAAARVLPAIEATIARLAAGPCHPRDMEQAGRALSSLTRTLRELNALAAQHQARAAEDDEPPRDIDEIRSELAQRLHALIDAEREKEEEAKQEET